MPQRYFVFMACWCSIILSGCGLFETTQTVAHVDRTYVRQEPDEDVVQLYQAFLEGPLDDTYLSEELWLAADQHVVDIDHQAVLDENGFRVGQIVGAAPGKLMELLSSKRACIDAKRRLIHCDETVAHPLGPVQPQTTFQVRLAGKSEEISLEQAQYCLDVQPTTTRDGRTQLEFTPRVEHRQRTLSLDVAADCSGWNVATDKPGRRFPQLSWKVVLAPGQSLIIGGNLEKTGSLGYRSFVQSNQVNPMQRVLILRGG